MDILKKDITDIRQSYAEYITVDDKINNVISAENTPMKLGLFHDSDLIFVFNGLGEMTVYVERIHRKELSLVKWIKSKNTIKKLKTSYPKDDIRCNVTIEKDYIDFTLYREWWVSWIKDLQ